MPSETVEDYLKQIYLLSQGTKTGRVGTGGLAAAIGVVPGTATSMVKTLADGGLVHYEPRGGVKLSRGGEKLALHVLRRHRLIELLLVNVLKLDWSEVHPRGRAARARHQRQGARQNRHSPRPPQRRPARRSDPHRRRKALARRRVHAQ